MLLGYLPPEKLEWKQVLDKRRGEYYQFVADFLPSPSSQDLDRQPGFPGKLSERDALLDQIYRDLSRSRKNAFSFYREPIGASRSCPLTPAPSTSSTFESMTPRLEQRLSLLRRLASINADYAAILAQETGNAPKTPHQPPLPPAPGTPSKTATLHSHLSPPELSRTRSKNGRAGASPSIVLEPASPAASEGPSEYFDEEENSGLISADEGASTSPSPPQVPSKDEDAGGFSSTGEIVDRRWHSLLRILYIYALLNPSIGYVQGMNEVLFVVLYVMGTSSHLPSVASTASTEGTDTVEAKDPAQEEEDATNALRYIEDSLDSPAAHAEADAFWCFSALIGEVRDLYDFDGVDHGTAGLRVSNRGPAEEKVQNIDENGMAGALKRFSLRLKWLDEDLWSAMRAHSLDPRMPYYSFRWLACLLSTELALPSVVRVWDVILSESNETAEVLGSTTTSKVEFLIDVCCALLIHVRGQILDAMDEDEEEEEGDEGSDPFSRAMAVLSTYPDGDIGPILELATLYRQRRMAAPLTGDGPPTEDDEETVLTLRQRAAKTVRGWTPNSSSATPSRPKWLSSPRQAMATTDTPSASSNTSTPSRSPGAVLQRYADALQSSDAAASLSKASTNWTAKAMATWGERGSGEKNGRDASPSPSSIVDRSPTARSLQSLFSKARSASTSSTSAQSQASATSPSQSVHPALRWSRDGMPDLPLPNVEDSPVGSQEYGYGKRPMSTFLGSRAAAGAHGTSSPSNSASGSPMTSPTLASSSRFGNLPSLQAGLQQQAARSTSAGPKPLLLRTAARPPREGSNNGSAEPEEHSRVVSSGPLAARNGRRRQRRAMAPSSEGGRGSETASGTSSVVEGASESGDESYSQSVSSARRRSSTMIHSSALPSLSQHGGDAEAEGSCSIAPASNSSGTGGVLKGLVGAERGTVPVSAFAKMRAPNNGEKLSSSLDDDATFKPNFTFGEVASSGDQPLNKKKPSLQRGVRRSKDSKDSREGAKSTSTTSPSNHSSLTESIIQQETPNGSVDWQSPGESGARSSRTSDEEESMQDNKVPRPRPDSVFEHPRTAPAPPVIEKDSPATESSAFSRPALALANDQNRYELSDEPTITSFRASSKPLTSRRSTSENVKVRSKRTFSSSRGSKRSTGDGTDPNKLTLNTARATAAAASHSGTSSALPSPGPNAGETMTSDELLARLEMAPEDSKKTAASTLSGDEATGTSASQYVTSAATPKGVSQGTMALESDWPSDVSPSVDDHMARTADSAFVPHDGGEEAFQAIGNALALADGPIDGDT